MHLLFGPYLTGLNLSDQFIIAFIEGLGPSLVLINFCINKRNLYQWKPWFLHQNKFCTKIRNYDFNLLTIKKISTKWDYGYAVNSNYSSLFQLWPFLHSLERQPIITPTNPKAQGTGVTTLHNFFFLVLLGRVPL